MRSQGLFDVMLALAPGQAWPRRISTGPNKCEAAAAPGNERILTATAPWTLRVGVGGVVGAVVASGAATIGAAGVIVGFAGPAVLWLFSRKGLGLRGMFGALPRCVSDRGAWPAGGRWLAGHVRGRLAHAPAAGRRWLAEADSFLFEVPPPQRGKALRNYLLTAPAVIAVSWTGALARRIRLTGSSPAAGRGNADDAHR